ncbi:malate/lactate/ureidoglycolate dehydrogenase [Geminicoccaceae bacterium 1502E]|nr:malate/lactate/ureidoglycolate dehydrogenase [Geminicoccaceae bacterium 1502E]
MATIAVEPLRRLVTATFEKAGCPSEEAQNIAFYLSRANLTGHDSHGVIRVPRYLEWLQQGLVKAGVHVQLAKDSDTLLIVDGQHGFGQTIGPEACRLGIERAKARGMAVVAIRASGHLGRIGDFAEMAIEEGIVSIHFVNAANSVLVAPFGARSRRFSTNPVCIGVPTGDDRPFVLDFATSMVAEGKCLVAQQGGKPIPDTALVAEDGRLTGDTSVLYGPSAGGGYPDPRKGSGAMRAFGEHKGSGLALACDLLAGALTGSGGAGDPNGVFHNGMLSIYLDPKEFDTGNSFADSVSSFIAWIRDAEPIDPQEGLLIPGDKERQTAAQRTAEGIPLADETWQAILAAARRSGLDQTEIDNLLS